MAGANVVCAVEIDADAAAVYSANHAHPVVVQDINNWREVADALAQYGPFDVIQWSPPCQPHSRSNANKTDNDPRALVMMAAARLIVHLQTPHYIMENVKGVITSPVAMD